FWFLHSRQLYSSYGERNFLQSKHSRIFRRSRNGQKWRKTLPTKNTGERRERKKSPRRYSISFGINCWGRRTSSNKLSTYLILAGLQQRPNEIQPSASC